jgi:gamma-glutamyltranspeptidase/glutathione hydrolase
VPLAGKRVRNPDIAASLLAIAKTKGDAFYRGALAERIAADAARHGAALRCGAVHASRACGTPCGRGRRRLKARNWAR